jgi:pyruvate formate lyase activating enzyme
MPHVARFWTRLEDGRIRCELCPRECAMREGQRGFCFVRQVVDGQLVLTTYGRSTGFCVDPIEKKPLNHFLPGSAALSFGTAGCNLGCQFCQNWGISRSREMSRLSQLATPEAIAREAVRSGCRSVAFTYNEPVIFAEYAIDTALACHELGVRTVAVTNGYVGEAARAELFAHMDAANVDLKAFTESFYTRLCFGHLAPVLETLEYLHRETDVWLEVTTLMVPGHNDDQREIERQCAWFAEHMGPDVPWHFTAFHPDCRMMDVPPTSLAMLRRARELARSHGLHYVYTGNLPDREGSTTFCPVCGEALVVRDGYRIRGQALVGSRCGRCGAAIAGVFEDAASRSS